MRIYDIIHKKRLGEELNKEEIDFFVSGATNGTIPDYQISALLMAICLNSMSEKETFFLTDAMLKSGDQVDLSRFGTLSVDKHSTGGVGDKTTLIVAPIVASLGATVAKMSGRGLGFTGGTVDKLESITGYKTTLDQNEFLAQAEKTGVVVAGQSADLAPADKKLYALRDVTATVDSIPLICSSVMSKKLACGSHSIVLDVKVGNGAFMKTVGDARILAREMVKTGKKFGKNMCAILTDMEVPLGDAVGNALEVYEAVEILSGRGNKRLRESCLTISSQMASMALNIDYNTAYNMCKENIKNGKALAKMKEWVGAQGGDVSLIENNASLISATYKKEYKAKKAGYISLVKAEEVGLASVMLGAGRMRKNGKIDLSAGILFSRSYSDKVNEGDTILTMYCSKKSLFKNAENILDDAISYSENKPPKRKAIIQKII